MNTFFHYVSIGHYNGKPKLKTSAIALYFFENHFFILNPTWTLATERQKTWQGFSKF